jgi:hypothetical protein
MRLNPKITWSWAWAGLALVVLVPSADFLTGKGGSAAVITSGTEAVKPVIDPVKTASVTPSVTPAAATPLDPALARKITLTPSSTPTKLALPAAPTPAEPEATETASLPPVVVAPRPAPLSQRPNISSPVKKTAPPKTPAAVAKETIVIPDDIAAEPVAEEDVAEIDPNRPVPPAGIADDPPDRESLRAYLAREGLLDNGNGTVDITAIDASDEYDPDGFYLSDGPNNDTRNMTRLQRLRWLRAHGIDPSELEPF